MAALPGREFDGRVTQVGRQVDAGSRTVPVRIELANADGVLRPGMSANAPARVAGRSQTILAVPPQRCSASASGGSRSFRGRRRSSRCGRSDAAATSATTSRSSPD